MSLRSGGLDGSRELLDRERDNRRESCRIRLTNELGAPALTKGLDVDGRGLPGGGHAAFGRADSGQQLIPKGFST